jgi:ribosomal protein L24E
MRIEFCNEAPIQDKVIDMVQRLILLSSKEEIKAIYDILRKRYNGEEYPTDAEKAKSYFKDHSALALLKNFYIPERSLFIGVDLPSWFNFQLKIPRVMVVGVDPLRNGEKFKDAISIGSPYGIHDDHCKVLMNDSDGSIYWRLISQLAEHYSVYVTDTFKVYFKCGRKNSSQVSCFTNPKATEWTEEIHQKIFAEEVSIVQPDLIVTLGSIPARWFSSIKDANSQTLKELSDKKDKRLSYNSIPILPLVHLSGRATTTALRLYGVDKVSQLPGKYFSLIHERLKPLVVPGVPH